MAGQTLHKCFGVIREGGPIAVAIVKIFGPHGGSIGCLPNETVLGDRGRHASPDDGVGESGQSEDLRHLRNVTEHVRQIADVHGATEGRCAAKTHLQVTDDGLARGQELVHQDVPRPHADATSRGQRPNAIFILGPHLEVVVDDGHLPVQHEVGIAVVGFEQLQKDVEHVDQIQAKLLVGLVPLTVPVSVRHDCDATGCHARHTMTSGIDQANNERRVRGPHLWHGSRVGVIGMGTGTLEGAMHVSGQTLWNPLGAVARSWGHFVRRPRATQIRTVVLIAAVIVGVSIWVATAPSGSSATTSTVDLANGGSSGAGLSPVSSASTSTRGVTDPYHQCGLSCGVPQFPGRRRGIRCGRRVRRTAEGHHPLRQADQRPRGDQRTQDQPDHHRLRPDQRGGHAVALQDLDRGLPGGLRRARRYRGMDRGQRAVHHPGGSDPVHRSVDHGHRLDRPGRSLPVVDGTRSGSDPPCGGRVGHPVGPAWEDQEGGGDCRGPGLGPVGPQQLSAAGPPRRRGHPGGRDHRLGPRRRPRRRTVRPHWSSSNCATPGSAR